jgi:hypothetical protein
VLKEFAAAVGVMVVIWKMPILLVKNVVGVHEKVYCPELGLAKLTLATIGVPLQAVGDGEAVKLKSKVSAVTESVAEYLQDPSKALMLYVPPADKLENEKLVDDVGFTAVE